MRARWRETVSTSPTRTELLAPVPRWTVFTKERLLEGVQKGVITKAEACEAHKISLEEFNGWWGAWCSRLAFALHATVKTRRSA